MSAVGAFLARGLSKVAMEVIFTLLSEKYLKQYAAELLIPYLRKAAQKTATPLDDTAVALLEKAFAEKPPLTAQSEGDGERPPRP